MSGPVTVADLKTHLGLSPASTTDEAAMQKKCDAANDLIAQLVPELVIGEDGQPLPDWPPRVSEAATIEAARLYGARGSVQGVAAFTDVGVSFIARLDPRVRELLELGEYQKSVVA